MIGYRPHTHARVSVHLLDILDRFGLTVGYLLEITIDNASLNYWMTPKLKSTQDNFAIEWPAFRNHLQCIPHVIQLSLCGFLNYLSVQGWTKSWEALEGGLQFEGNGILDNWKSQRLWKEGNGRINMVWRIRLGVAKITEKVLTSGCIESPETVLHQSQNAGGNGDANTCSSKWVHHL